MSALNEQVGGGHYKTLALQPLEAMRMILTHEEYVGFLKGNILKYSIRQGRKDGSDDGEKAKHYHSILEEYLDDYYG